MGNKVCCQDRQGLNDDVNEEVQIKVHQHPPFQKQDTAKLSQSPFDHQIPLPKLNYPVHQTMDYKKFFHSEFQLLSKRHIFQKDDYIYEGSINQHGKPHGLGKVYRYCTNNFQTCNALYVGYFDHGKAQGQGAYIFSDGSYYRGQFKNNLPQGDGQYHTANSIKIRKGKHEIGYLKDQKMEYEFQGQFKNGLKHKGTLKWNNNVQHISLPSFTNMHLQHCQYVYVGTFDDNEKFEGIGSLADDKGVYQGSFHKGEKNGKGKYFILNDGKQILRYDGEYKNGKKQGHGVIYKYDGTKIAYEGEMREGLPHGKGKIYGQDIEAQGQFYEGLNKQYIDQ